MNVKTLALAVSFTSVLAATMVLPQTLIHFNNSESSQEQQQQQVQQATITVNAANLREPLILKVNRKATSIAGQIKLNGKVLQNLSERDTRINLAPALRSGKNVIEISGKYSPADSTVTVELTGPNAHVNQQTTGSGKLNQIVAILVR